MARNDQPLPVAQPPAVVAPEPGISTEELAGLTDLVALSREIRAGLAAKVTAVHPNGYGPQLSATQLAELGAVLGARGLQKSAVVGLLHTIQEVAVKTVVEMAPTLLSKMDELDKSKFHVAIQQIMALPTLPVPTQIPTTMQRFAGTPLPTVDYISRDAVLQLLQLVAERPLAS